MSKALVTLDGVPLAATQGVAWRFTSGVVPYSTTLAVHQTAWERLRPRMGMPLVLEITDHRGVTLRIEQVYILHVAPSDSPHRVSFVVADRRWKWQYDLVVRDYNIPRKTGNRSSFGNVPVETRVTVDRYDYLAYSIKADGAKWTAREALEETLKVVVGDGEFLIESFPLQDASGAGQFTLQGVTLRDPGDAALSRLLSNIPGADLYVRADGKVVVYDATDLAEVKRYISQLPQSTWDGDVVTLVDRVQVRPSAVHVHYQRELEVVFTFADDYAGSTSSAPSRTAPFLENVIPTVDPETTVTEYDPESGTDVEKTVPPGTWVNVASWLAAMDEDRPSGSLPWTFETIRAHWVAGDLDGVLGARGLDLDEEANVSLRVAALKQHFRQTFRINRRIMERVRDVFALRVAVLDPVTGARAPAAVWGQACVIPSEKGKFMAARGGGETKVFRNVDYLAPSQAAGSSVVSTAPGPTQVAMIDHELGIFRLEWIASPYGTVDSFIPCKLVGTGGDPQVVDRDLTFQDTKPMAANGSIEGGTNGLFLANQLDYSVVLTIIPNSPNNERQFHRVEIDPASIANMFRAEVTVSGGRGPVLELFIPPGEHTARFAWEDDSAASTTLARLLGLDEDGVGGGLEGPELPGYRLANDGLQGERHLEAHARAVAAEMLVQFVDSPQGNMVARMPNAGTPLRLVGNTAGVAVRVAQAPSAKVDTVHTFPGTARSISRFSLLPEATRIQILGTIPFRD